MVDRLIKMTILLSLLFSVTKITYSMDSISNLPNKTEFGIRGDNQT